MASQTEEHLRNEFRMNYKRVVVADDLAQVLSAIAALLKGSFNVVSLASDGHTALEAVMAFDPDVAVLDISMPGLTGIEVARELKKRDSRAKIVFLTVHQDPDYVRTALHAGGTAHVVEA